MELNLSGDLPDNLGDILTMRYTGSSIVGDPTYDRFVEYLKRHDVPLAAKARAWNYFQIKYGEKEATINTPEDLKKLARTFPSDVL